MFSGAITSCKPAPPRTSSGRLRRGNHGGPWPTPAVRPTSVLIRSAMLRANASRSPRNEPVSVAELRHRHRRGPHRGGDAPRGASMLNRSTPQRSIRRALPPSRAPRSPREWPPRIDRVVETAASMSPWHLKIAGLVHQPHRSRPVRIELSDAQRCQIKVQPVQDARTGVQSEPQQSLDRRDV